MEPGDSFRRDAKIREEPVRVFRRGLRELSYNRGQFCFREAIEKKMRHHQIVMAHRWTPRREVMVKETNAWPGFR